MLPPSTHTMANLSQRAVTEIRSLVRSNDSRTLRYLRIYMLMRKIGGDNNILQVLDSRDLLTPPVVFTAWETGRVDILRNCVRMGVPIKASSSLPSAIRSGSPATLDFCVEQGGEVSALSRPYCHCTTPEMMQHVWDKYGCKLYDRDAVFPRDLDVSIKYMRMGGTVAQMGKEMNDLCHREGNWQRSLPIKLAYLKKPRESYESEIASLILGLPKGVVNEVCEYV